jgi:hypothetical protein
MTEHHHRSDTQIIRIDSQGIALVLIVAALAFLLATAGLWVALR